MSFSFCMNKCDLLAICALTLLYQAIDLKPESKMMRDDERLVNIVLKTLHKSKSPGFVDLERVASMLITLSEPSGAALPAKTSRKISLTGQTNNRVSPPANNAKMNVPQALNCPYPTPAPTSEGDISQQEKLRRRTMQPSTNDQVHAAHCARSRQSFDSLRSDMSPMHHHQDHRLSMSQISPTPSTHRISPVRRIGPNLDYLSLNNTPFQSKPATPSSGMQGLIPVSHGQGLTSGQMAKASGITDSEWEALLGSMDGGLNNVYDAIYGGSSIVNEASMAPSTASWSPDSWDLSSFNIGELRGNPGAPQSVLSMSDESLSSGEEVTPSELGLSVGSMDYPREMGAANCGAGDTFSLEGLEVFPL